MTTNFSRASLEQAAFWNESVCLVCGAPQNDPEIDGACSECGSPETVPASVALAFLAEVEAADE